MAPVTDQVREPAEAGQRVLLDDGLHRAHAIQVLTVGGGRIARIVSFNDAGLVHLFGLPGVAPARR